MSKNLDFTISDFVGEFPNLTEEELLIKLKKDELVPKSLTLDKLNEILKNLVKNKTLIKEQKGELITYHKSLNYKEIDIYPALEKWLTESLGLICKSFPNPPIIHGTKGQNKFRFPDIIGYRNTLRIIDYKDEKFYNKIIDLANKSGEPKIEWVSFEVKREIRKTDVRDFILECLGNSSWANRRYLVTERIDQESINEIRSVSDTHNIGLIEIKLSENNNLYQCIPSQSMISIECKRASLDVQAFYELALKWTDLKKWLSSIK
jgi:uncharacterized protein